MAVGNGCLVSAMNKTSAQLLTDFTGDALVVMEHGALVIGNEIIDTAAQIDPAIAEYAHRDAIQLIPPSPAFPRQQFAAGLLDHVRVLGNRIDSTGKLQGIFGSDGLFRYLAIVGNTIQTRSQHYITISGMLSGWIEGNILPDGSPCPVRLEPLRIGGQPDAQNVRVLSFAGWWHYAPLHEIVDQNTLAADVVVDVRSLPVNTQDIYLCNFHLEAFWAAAQALPVDRDALNHARALQALALEFGEKVG